MCCRVVTALLSLTAKPKPRLETVLNLGVFTSPSSSHPLVFITLLATVIARAGFKASRSYLGAIGMELHLSIAASLESQHLTSTVSIT
ncbi:hypothetical protein AA313_de0206003 [Arthrobotrys entomopaga]|nr:hypothetical protein AA313_de0206003 [Arthrobotrys entomopaga]